MITDDSVAKLPLKEQIIEIDRRCAEEYEYRQARQLPMTPVHIAAVLRISQKTYQSWMRGEEDRSRMNKKSTTILLEDNLRRTDAERDLLRERAEVLSVWEAKCAASLADCACDPNSKSAVTGANFALERMCGFRRNEEVQIATKSGGLEGILDRVAARIMTGEKEKVIEVANIADDVSEETEDNEENEE